MKHEPAFPKRSNDLTRPQHDGLSKRELACIELRVPKTGDPELDAIIREARLADAAGLAMQGLLANKNCNPNTFTDAAVAEWSVSVAAALISELEKQKNG